VRVDPTLDRLRSTTDASRLEQRIGPAFGLPGEVYVVLAEGPELQALLEGNERLSSALRSELPGLAFQPPTRLLPSAATQASTMTRVAAANLSIDRIGAALEHARAEAGFMPGAFAPFLARLPALLDPAQRMTYEGFETHGLGDLIDRFVARDDQRWLLATYVFPASAAEVSQVQAVVTAVDPAQTLTGLPLVNRDLASRFLPDFVKGLAIGGVVVVVLVFAAFRSARLSVLALLPTVIGLIWAAGVLAIAGAVLDLFAIFAIVTFVGIGVDYGIHLVHRYGEHRDATRALAELAPVILVAAAITFLGYATLTASSYPPLRSIGLVSSVSVVALAAASLLVLPALLSGTVVGNAAGPRR
jgi:predicted exporter